MEPEIEEDYVLLNVNLKSIIKRIIIAPNSQGWYRELITSSIEKCGFDFEIEDSALAGKPLHIWWGHLGIIDR